jgi:Arc/MetJ-type ribon-helix-helix transcriptional regulator
MDWLKYDDLKSSGLGAFAKESEVIKEAVAEVPDEKDEFDVVIKEGSPAVPEEKREYIVFVQKRWDGGTGESLDDSKQEFSLEQLESQKAGFDAEMDSAKAKSDAIKKAIADFKKL